MQGYDKMILTNFKLSSGADILRSGICIKECPTENGLALKEGSNCKSNEKVKCKGKKTYISRDAFDFCLPVGRESL